MTDRSHRRLTPGQWLVLKLAAVIPIALFIARVVIFVQPGELVAMIVVPMGLILFDGLVTKWTYEGRRKTA